MPDVLEIATVKAANVFKSNIDIVSSQVVKSMDGLDQVVNEFTGLISSKTGSMNVAFGCAKYILKYLLTINLV